MRLSVYCDRDELEDEIPLITSCAFHGKPRTILTSRCEPSLLRNNKTLSFIVSNKCDDAMLQLAASTVWGFLS